MYKELILKTTINLYAHYGIRGVSMNQVAGALRISKKTLYAEFGSKEELLCNCLDYEENRIGKILMNTIREHQNPVETVIMITHNLLQYRLYFCPAYYNDLYRFKKAIEKQEVMHRKIAEKYYLFLQKGKEEGYFIAQNDYHVVASMLVEMLLRGEAANKPLLIQTFLRGLCTDRGISAMDELAPESLQNNTYNYN